MSCCSVKLEEPEPSPERPPPPPPVKKVADAPAAAKAAPVKEPPTPTGAPVKHSYDHVSLHITADCHGHEKLEVRDDSFSSEDDPFGDVRASESKLTSCTLASLPGHGTLHKGCEWKVTSCTSAASPCLEVLASAMPAETRWVCLQVAALRRR